MARRKWTSGAKDALACVSAGNKRAVARIAREYAAYYNLPVVCKDCVIAAMETSGYYATGSAI